MKQQQKVYGEAIRRIAQRIDRGEFAAAAGELDLLRQAHGAQADLLHLRGLTRLGLGEAAKARREIEAALALYPQFADFHVSHGRACEALGDAAAALQAYGRALELAPGHVHACIKLGEALVRAGQFKQVVEVTRTALACGADDYRLDFQLGFALIQISENQAAAESLAKAITKKPDFCEAHNNLGNILRRQGKKEAALSEYDKALAGAPGYIDALYNKSALLLALGQDNEAYTLLEKIVAQAPSLAVAWANLAEAALACDKTDVLAKLAETCLSEGKGTSGPLLALTNLARFEHDYARVLQVVSQHGHKLQNADPIDHVPYLIALDLVIAKWLRGDRSGRKAYLEALLSGFVNVRRDLGTTKIFFEMLLRLERWNEKHPVATSDRVVLTCIGDSHALTLANAPLQLDGREGRVNSCFVMGAKMFHLSQSGKSKYKVCLDRALQAAPRGIPVLLCFGEIDCRLWEGIVPAWRAGKLPNLDKAVKQQAASYVESILANPAGKGLEFWFQSVPAPSLDWNTVGESDKQLLIGVIRSFNAGLRETVNKHASRYIDAYALTAKADGTSNQLWHLDAHHLKPTYLQQLLAQEQQSAVAQPAMLVAFQQKCQERRWDEARNILEANPGLVEDMAGAWLFLGIGFHQIEQLGNARACYERALVIKESLTAASNNLALILRAQGDLVGALHAIEGACRFAPTNAALMQSRGMLQETLGMAGEAAASYEEAVQLAPANHKYHLLLAQARIKLGELSAAVEHYREALKLNPGLADAHFNLGHVYRHMGRVEDAVLAYSNAWKIKPDFLEARLSHCRSLMAAGRNREAIGLAIEIFRCGESAKTRAVLATCLSGLAEGSYSSDETRLIKQFLVRALDESWTRPAYMTPAALKLFRSNRVFVAWQVLIGQNQQTGEGEVCELTGNMNLAELYADELLRAMLRTAPVPDNEIESFLTAVRMDLLARVAYGQGTGLDEAALGFYCDLARQCFINEYLYAVTQEEKTLCDELARKFTPDAPGGQWQLVALASYMPLHILPSCERLLERMWPEEVEAVVRQQVAEPLEERRLQAEIKSLTAICDTVSAQVRRQYEENPYPRWVRPAPPSEFADINTRMRRWFPLADIVPLALSGPLEILIAGCGTGQQSIETALNYPDAHVLAIDLSLSSLGFALRKSREIGVENVEYAHADILELDKDGRQFDLIESSGVLHHMENPECGWQVLFDRLRPGGLMNIALYSELARQNVVAAREFIASKGYGKTAEDIRACRHEMVQSRQDMPWRSIFRWGDFYSVSACRDLIFHIQEHRFTIPRIANFLERNDMTLIGFNVAPQTLTAYRQCFPDDPAAVNLGNWDVFEQEKPDTFAGMYQFWIQKRS